jgi:hypothetical protein
LRKENLTVAKHSALSNEVIAAENSYAKVHTPTKSTLENTKLELDRYSLLKTIQSQVENGENSCC